MVSLADRFLDASIFWSFDHSGFARHARRFRPADLDVDLSGQVVLITGANSGIGLATATALAMRRASVWMLCRSEQRGEQARRAILAAHPAADLRLEIVDVSQRASIEAFVRRATPARLDRLIHNAGVLPDRRELTEDGLELTFATNVAGPHLLTTRLLGALEATAGSRVLTVSSGGMYAQRLDVRDLEYRSRKFDGVEAYANTKRAELILAAHWARRCPSGVPAFHAMHPGWADTPAVQASLPRFHRFMRGRLRTPEEGADTLVWLAAVREIPVPSGAFWFDRQRAPEHLLARTRESEAEARQLIDRCMDFSSTGAV